MIKPLISLAAALALAAPTLAQQEEEEVFPSPNEIVEQAAPEEWMAIAPEDLLVMTLAPQQPGGEPREVVIQLMPPPFSQGWIANIKLLSRSGYYDGLSVIRVQDNYVVQWGDPAEETAEAKPLPDGLNVMEESEYSARNPAVRNLGPLTDLFVRGSGRIDRPVPWTRVDAYSSEVAIRNGWPIAMSGTRMWPVHCYGMVGVARAMPPNTGDGSSLYTVIGHAPRHLDRNLAVVGRIISGMEYLSSLPRGHGPAGFFAEDEADKRTEILSVRVVADLMEGQPVTISDAIGHDYAFEYLSTESDSFARYAEARANRRDPFFIRPAGGADVCNIPVPVRPTPNG